jgi:hypothetical protein
MTLPFTDDRASLVALPPAFCSDKTLCPKQFTLINVRISLGTMEPWNLIRVGLFLKI